MANTDARFYLTPPDIKHRLEIWRPSEATLPPSNKGTTAPDPQLPRNKSIEAFDTEELLMIDAAIVHTFDDKATKHLFLSSTAECWWESSGSRRRTQPDSLRSLQFRR